MPEYDAKHTKPFILIVIFNVVLAFLIVGSLHLAIRISTDNQIKDDIKNLQNKTGLVADQLDSYLLSMDSVGGSYATYIQEEKLTMEAAIKYLNHWKGFYNSVTILEVDTYDTWTITLEEASAIKGNFADKEWVRNVCEKAKTNQEDNTKIAVSEVFRDADSAELMLAFYKKMQVENKDCLLLFVTSLNGLQQGGMNVQGINPEYGIIIDKQGHIVLGNYFAETHGTTDNYFERLGDEIGVDKTALIHEKIQNGEEGIYDVVLQDSTEWKAFYHPITVADGWTYIYFQNMKEIYKENNIMRFVYLSCALMMLWLVADIVVYFIYSTRLRRSMKIIEQQNENLMFANKAKTSFVSNISHEIRTPINAVLGMDEMIIRECTDEKIRSYAYDIQEAGRVLLSLINDVLDFSKIESGKLEIVPVEYDVVTVIGEVCNMIELKAKAKYLSFELDVSPDLPTRLYGDETRLRQIVINLLTNAVKYTEKGSVTLTIKAEKTTENEVMLNVSVKDTGIGVKTEELGKLFSEYDRLDLKKNQKIEGTGLGLSIVRKLLEMMDSKIEVDSVYGLGSVFYFSLKQKVIDWTPIGDYEKKRKQMSENKKEIVTELRAPKAKILAVDDTQVNLMVVRGLLRRTGIKVDTAEDGFKCLEMLEKKKYDLILLDHRMPKMDGIETIHKIRETAGRNQNTPVIALTANVVSGAREMYISEGFNDFLSKPINGASLEKTIMEYLPEELIEVDAENSSKIDQNAGIAACGGEDIYREVKEVFAQQAAEIIEKIRKYQEQRNLKDYITLVHGLKSSARLLGAMELSEEAAKLESAAKEENWEVIDGGTSLMLLHYGQIAEIAKKS